MSRSLGIVAPACNEASVLRPFLESLLMQQGVTLDAVLVANGCRDLTASIARSFVLAFRRAGHRLRVVETPVASKTGALNLGDSILTRFPRAYIDADVVLSPGALGRLASVLDETSPRLASPALSLTPQPTWLANEIAGHIEALPPYSCDVMGGGIYAVNAAGRARWATFPDVIADDAYVVSRFGLAERVRLADVSFRPRFPGIDRLLPTFTRWEAGLLQLSQMGVKRPQASRWMLARLIIRNPRRWVSSLIVVGLKTAARRQARRQLDRGPSPWARADGFGS
jgi:hypothetical protein